MATQHTGKIATWKDDKGFGFIIPDQGGQQVFFHISNLSTKQTRPAEQMKVSYMLRYDERQRPQAVAVRLPLVRNTGSLLPVLVSSVFFLVLTLAIYVLQLPVWVLAGYMLASFITFCIYGVDKASAVRGAQRVPEDTLHLLELLGGWPGALVAQSYYHHKTVKASFQSVFWGIVVCHVLVLLFCAGYSIVRNSL